MVSQRQRLDGELMTSNDLARDLYIIANRLCEGEPMPTDMLAPLPEIVMRICAEASPVLTALIAVKLANYIQDGGLRSS